MAKYKQQHNNKFQTITPMAKNEYNLPIEYDLDGVISELKR